MKSEKQTLRSTCGTENPLGVVDLTIITEITKNYLLDSFSIVRE